MADLELPTDLKSRLDRQEFDIHVRKGGIVASRSYHQAKGSNREAEIFRIEWTEYRASLGRKTTTTMDVGTMNAYKLGGSFDGYLITLEDKKSTVAVPIGLWASSNKVAWELETYNIKFISKALSGENFAWSAPGFLWWIPIGIVLLGCLWPAGITVLTLWAIYVHFHAKKYRWHGSRRPEISEFDTRNLIRDISLYCYDNDILYNLWLRENQSPSPRV